MKNDADADSARVEEILRGANRAPFDPDIELSSMLAKLRGSDDLAALDVVLERLARDARPD